MPDIRKNLNQEELREIIDSYKNIDNHHKWENVTEQRPIEPYGSLSEEYLKVLFQYFPYIGSVR